MAWTVDVNSNGAEYQYSSEDLTFFTDAPRLVDIKFDKEPSGGYKEPDDDVANATFLADSEHGLFKWVVTARRSGFSTSVEIEEVLEIEVPEAAEIIHGPSFYIEQD
ncbi:hypothetical protein P5705_18385 [Pseudomonas entomophila]|uniref:hypothetical protein n=1 Tax=Pseudomonas entomophila TaxID=312306 RepID=UPI0024052AB3|nr:hypothetical protein [Pseudomonas entomophila]MDF9619618.1 hypothetical protein [Pseudomonas entomophila]